MVDTIDHIFILCDPTNEPDRFQYLQTWLQDNHIDSARYTIGLSCYGSDITAEQAFTVYNPWQNRKPVEQERNFNSYNLKPSEISLVLNWYAVAKQAVEKNYTTVMILESDILFFDHFLDNLQTSLGILQRGKVVWDFLSISGREDLRPKRDPKDTQLAWFRNPGYYHTRTTDAMIFQVSMLQKILGTLFPFAEVLDWELNYQLALHSSQSFWLDPPICRQGSGKEYPTTL
jgi:hypothetical protein